MSGRRSQSTLAKLFGGIVAAVLAMSVVLSASAAPTSQSKKNLSKHDYELLAEARAAGEPTVTLLIAAQPGANSAVASGIASLGGEVSFRDDTISYVTAIVPTDKVEAAAQLSGVESVDLDEVLPLYDPQPEPDGAVPPTPQTPPSASTPQNNPYMPIGDTGAVQFMTANPSWDGRGVTVGIIDSGVTLDHPALQTTSTGERKIVDWVTYTHPTVDGDPTWVELRDRVSGASFSYKGVAYTAPSNTSFRIGLFNERDSRLGGEVGSDVNRDGNGTGTSGIFAVLWHLDSNTVWVDTNQNNSFADEQGMTDYKVRYDVGTFGVDNPATDLAEAMPFVIQTLKNQRDSTGAKTQFVNIGIVSGAHGSHVAGIVAANQMFGGAMTGAAPGAKLVSVRVCLFISGCTAHALVEGMIYAAKYAKVDVINMSIGGLPALNDANNTRAELYDRLIRVYKVQMFISAGNSGPGMNTVGDPSVTTTVMSVGSYITKETWQKNYGSDSEFVDNMHYYSSRGPREDGGFKPNIVAPGSAISTVPRWQPGGPLLGTYTLPAGYAMFNGTSMAAPQAAGATALLVSAAKQTGAQFQPYQLRQAINTSADFDGLSGSLDRYGAYEIGNGLMNVGAAWELLKTNIKTTEISSSVPVNTVLSGFLKTPGFGAGIYDREGVVAGQSYTRQYTFTRTKGGSDLTNYQVSWVGNDGTFSSPATIRLPKNQPATLDVTINPTSAGVHSAILNLDDPNTVGVDYQTMNVVVAASEFTPGNGYSVTHTGTVGRNQTLSYFFRIPAGTPAFKVDFSGPSTTAGTGQARFLRWHPYGVGIDSNASTQCFLPPRAAGCTAETRTTSNPLAGVWEVTVDAARTSDAANVPFTLTASILGASVSPNPDTISSATIGTPVARSYTATNLFGTFTGRMVGTSLGSARIATPTIANLEQQQFLVNVAAGSTSLRATIGGTSDRAADLDLFVYNCTTGTCVLAGQNADGDSEESVTISNPAAGTWLILVDGYAVPAGTTTYKYIDVFANSAFGTISITDSNASRSSGTSWNAPATVTANAAPAAGRVLYGNVQVRTDANVLVGSGDVIVESVSP